MHDNIILHINCVGGLVFINLCHHANISEQRFLKPNTFNSEVSNMKFSLFPFRAPAPVVIQKSCEVEEGVAEEESEVSAHLGKLRVTQTPSVKNPNSLWLCLPVNATLPQQRSSARCTFPSAQELSPKTMLGRH